MKKRPTLSIITICYNIKDEIARTCESIVNQTWQDFEWIVVDGGSTDGTVEVLKKYQNRMSVFISEPDKGVYNAMNKGIKLAQGKWLNFMNGGDCFAANDVLEKVFKDKKYTAEVLYGDMNLMKKGEFLRKITFPETVDPYYFYKSYIAHPSSFIKKKLFDEYGLYNENYRIASDWEKWVIFIHNNIAFKYLNQVIADFDDGGISGKNAELARKERSTVIDEYYSRQELKQFKNRKKIIVCGQDNLCIATGGSISIFRDFCNKLAPEYDIYGCYFAPENGVLAGLNEGVSLTNLRTRYNNQTFDSAMNLYVDALRPDLVVFFFPHDYVAVHWAEKNKKIPRLLMLHSRPDVYLQSKSVYEALRNAHDNTIIQILLPSYYAMLPDFVKNNPIVCIPNAAKHSDFRQDSKKEKKKFVYLSRIDDAKGHEFLINAFAQIAKKYPDWQLDIYGQSEPPIYEKILKQQVKELKLQKQIHFMGVTREPLKVLQNYDFCVFPSWYEGFPVGLTEAHSVGLPAIGFKGCSGVNELINDGVNGYLADDTLEDFAAKIELLIQNKELRRKMAKAAYIGTLQYSEEIVYKKWSEVISAAIEKKKIPYTLTAKVSGAYQVFSLDKIYDIRRSISLQIQMFKERRLSRYYLFGFIPFLSVEEQ